MKKTFILLSLFLVFVLLMLTLSSCGNDPARDFSNEYKQETDFQFALEFNEIGRSRITESPDGYYFLCRNFLYFLDKKTMEAIPLCKKPNCLHDHVSDEYISLGKVTCDAFIGQSSYDGGIFYYDNALYVLSEIDVQGSGRPRSVLQKYAPDGTFLETFYTFPVGPKSIFRHRGYFYYIYEDTSTIAATYNGQAYGTYRLVQVSLSNKSEKEIMSDPLEVGWFDEPLAYGKYIYLYNSGFNGVSNLGNNESIVEQYLIYDTETGETSVMERPEINNHFDYPFLCKDGIMYAYLSPDYRTERNVQFYRDDLSGKKPEEFFVAERGTCKWSWDGTYYYEDNRAEMWHGTDAKRTINVYNEAHELVDTITFEKVDNNPDNEDFSRLEDEIVFASEDYLFFQEGYSNMKLFAVDKKQIGTGNAVPFLVWKSPVQTSE